MADDVISNPKRKIYTLVLPKQNQPQSCKTKLKGFFVFHLCPMNKTKPAGVLESTLVVFVRVSI